MRPIYLTETEEDDYEELCRSNQSFYTYIYKARRDYTETLLDELHNILYGKIPRNFVINIKAGVGRQRGVFKSSFASQLALYLDPTFNIKERVGFTTYLLNKKLDEYTKKRQIFILDEQVRDLKIGSEQRLANIIDACRERQLCFILVGVQEIATTVSDYQLERLGESDDKYLPEKTVAFALKKTLKNETHYRGIFKWDITPLEGNKLGTNPKLTTKKWAEFWKDYMILKSKHQELAIKQKLTGFDFESCAKRIMKSREYEKAKGSSQKLKNLVYKSYPDNTHEERRMIHGELI